MKYDFIVGYNMSDEERDHLVPISMKELIHGISKKMIQGLINTEESRSPLYFSSPSLDGKSLICCKF